MSLLPNIDLAKLLNLPTGPLTVAEASIKITVDPLTLKAAIHVEEKIGPLAGPPIDLEIDPAHALHVAGVGIGGLVQGVFGGKTKPAG